ncbi:MAG: hypothetical protein EAX81_07520 [Candidatus Thorarchaeota archaeon]|nr:hypothetical protein [Candidatus Thorarchaeota archaeon]
MIVMSEESQRKVAEMAKNSGDLQTSLAIIRTIEAEKRTHLAQLRTGFGVLTIPLSLLTILIATSKYYIVEDVLALIIALIAGIIGLGVMGSYLVATALLKLRKSEKLKNDTCSSTERLLRNYEAES